MSTLLSSRLLDAAVSDAKSVLASAQVTDVTDGVTLAASTAMLERVLWTLDDEPDVAAQVDAEDGVARPVYKRYVREQVAA